ncbi:MULTISPECIES: hypothetical protein [Streptomyces]|uniref:hypothetical protein n=1 Tax=Streptomyces TaxID=1883 RepID=UPI00190554A3|nr:MULTISPECIES: hypothetical protein [unclassified Streptomyces]MCU4747519.1 hypothetical protein [Streptomyces sp. G-5]QQN78138.1 hypothetical protein IPZ77_12265 [Streptomyces sp. XC 2026]
MTITDEIRKTVTTASYAAAGTADLAAEKLRELRTHAPELREQAQSTFRVYAAKAKETYDELSERGKGAVETWRAERAAAAREEEERDIETPEVIVERAEPGVTPLAKGAPTDDTKSDTGSPRA